jgi:hypothetical protein
MQTDPTARHSPIGPFQRVCYLVHLARDGRMAAAPGTPPPALHPDRRRARWEGPNRGRGRPVRGRTIPEGVRGKARSPTGLHGDGPGHRAICLVCPRPDSATWAGSPAASWPTAPRPNAPSNSPNSSAASTPRGRTGHDLAVAAQGLHPPTASAWPPPATPRLCASVPSPPPAGTPASRPPRPGPGLRGAQPWRPPRPRAVVGRAVPVGPPRGAVRHLGRQRGGRAVQRKSRPPAHHPGVGDHPPGRPQPPAGRPTRQPPRPPPRRPSRPRQPVPSTPGASDGGRYPLTLWITHALDASSLTTSLSWAKLLGSTGLFRQGGL